MATEVSCRDRSFGSDSLRDRIFGSDDLRDRSVGSDDLRDRALVSGSAIVKSNCKSTGNVVCWRDGGLATSAFGELARILRTRRDTWDTSSNDPPTKTKKNVKEVRQWMTSNQRTQKQGDVWHTPIRGEEQCTLKRAGCRNPPHFRRCWPESLTRNPAYYENMLIASNRRNRIAVNSLTFCPVVGGESGADISKANDSSTTNILFAWTACWIFVVYKSVSQMNIVRVFQNVGCFLSCVRITGQFLQLAYQRKRIPQIYRTPHHENHATQVETQN